MECRVLAAFDCLSICRYSPPRDLSLLLPSLEVPLESRALPQVGPVLS